jgi:hypothetical protein
MEGFLWWLSPVRLTSGAVLYGSPGKHPKCWSPGGCILEMNPWWGSPGGDSQDRVRWSGSHGRGPLEGYTERGVLDEVPRTGSPGGVIWRWFPGAPLDGVPKTGPMEEIPGEDPLICFQGEHPSRVPMDEVPWEISCGGPPGSLPCGVPWDGSPGEYT